MRTTMAKLLTRLTLTVAVAGFVTSATQSIADGSTACATDTTDFAIAVHGGASKYPDSRKTRNRAEELEEILKDGTKMLANGATALSVVARVISEMEDNGAFNAGQGGKPNKAGELELDASIMDGKTQNAGAVASLRKIKNPILGAVYVMENTENVLFVGPSADSLLEDAGLETAAIFQPKAHDYAVKANEYNFGTVGAAVLDRCGNLAAGTSTGGFGTKIPGRVGDSPLIGAGTYANADVAVSATGHGEYFMRYVIAYDIAARIAYGQSTAKDAAYAAIETLGTNGGKGSVIVVDKSGKISTPFNTRGMVRGYATANSEPSVSVN